MSKKAKIIAGFSSAVVIGAGVPTAVVWGVKDKITNSSNSGGSVTPNPTPNPSISVDDALLKDNVGNNVTDTSILDDLLNDANSDQIKNELINSGIINSDAESLIKKLYFKLSDNTNQVPGQYVNIDLHVIKTDDTDVELSNNIPTKVGIINFNKNNFLNSFSKVDINTLYNSLQSTQIINTIYGFNAGFPQNSLLNVTAKLSSKSQLLPSTDTWLVNFDMQLNNNFVYKTSNNITNGQPTFTNMVVAEDCATSSTQNINIDLSTLIQNIGLINNTTNANNLKDDNQQLKNFVKDANIVFNNDWIRDASLSVSKVNGDGGEFLALNVSVTLFNGKMTSTGNVATKIKIVNLNETTLRSYFENSVNSEEQINSSNLLTTLNSSNCGLSQDCLNNSTSINANGTYESQSTTYFKYNLNVNLNNSYCFFNEINSEISSQKTISDLLTKVVSQYIVDVSNLRNDIINTASLIKLNDIISKNPQQLLDYVKSFNIVQDPNYITSCTLSHSVESNKVKLTYTIHFADGTETTVSALTSMNVVTYNEESIRNIFKSVNTSLSGQTLVSKIVSADSGLNSALSNSTTMNTINDSYFNDSNNVPYIKCNLQLLLNSNYCFILNGKYTDSASINNVETAIKYNYSYNIPNVEKYTTTLSTVEQVNNLKSSQSFLEALKQNNFVIDSTWIRSVNNIQYIIKDDGYVYYNAQIIWTDGTINEINLKTGIKGIQSYNVDNLISNLKVCSTEDQIKQIESSPTNYISGFPSNSIESLNLTPNSWYNGYSGIFKTYNINIALSNGYAYLNPSNNSLNSEINLVNNNHDINSYWTSIPYDISPNWQNFDDACIKITNSYDMIDFVNNIKNNIIKYNVYKDSNWIKNVSCVLKDQQPPLGTIYVITVTYNYVVYGSNPTETHEVKFNATPIFGF